MSLDISGYDHLDVEKLTDRFEELESEREALTDELGEAETDVALASHGDGDPTGELVARVTAAQSALEEFDASSDGEEFTALKDLLADELCGNGGDYKWRGDWYPQTLINDSAFEDYARELAEDCGMINRNANWPNNCIDWAKAARELQQDYTATEINGVTFWYR